MIDSGKPVQKYDAVRFVKVKAFPYRGRTFTVKPRAQVRELSEVNLEEYACTLRTSLNQAFRPMNIAFKEERKVALADFI